MPAAADRNSSSAGTEPLSLDKGGFALVSEDSDSALLLDSVAAPMRIVTAFCRTSTAYRVTYLHPQVGDSQHPGPEIVANFKNLRGELYAISKGAPGGETCYFPTDSSLVAGAVPLRPPPDSTCPPNWIRTLAEVKRQAVAKCWPMFSGPRGVQVLAAQFVPHADSVLASVVVFDSTSLVFQDFPVRYPGPDATTWRVDDEGVFDPAAFTVLCLSRVRGTWVMVLTWGAEEGEDAYLLAADSGNVFREVTQRYRYWIPD